MATAGVHYPSSEREFRSWFQTDLDCLDYIDWLRGNGSRVCTHCGIISPTKPVTGRVWRCPSCDARVSRTAGTIFERTRTPLTIWYAAAWELCFDKGGVSALSLQRRMNIGSYQTAWMMLNRYRWAMKKAGKDKLSGVVEVDVTALGGPKKGKRGKGAGGKVYVAIAVEKLEDGGFGRCRLRVIPGEAIHTMRGFLKECVEEGTQVVADKHSCYPEATKGLYTLKQHNISGDDLVAHEVLPGVHRVASLLKRWLMGTYQGSFGHDHVAAYLDEFTFRFNRRNSRQRGLLFYRLLKLSVEARPLRYRDVVVNSKAKDKTPVPPAVKRVSSATLYAVSAGQPWRTKIPVP
jgi:hypothetical protein